eukprot:448048-Amphidinium_carterae.1
MGERAQQLRYVTLQHPDQVPDPPGAPDRPGQPFIHLPTSHVPLIQRLLTLQNQPRLQPATAPAHRQTEN